MGVCLVVAVGLMGSEDPADSTFWEYKGKETTKSHVEFTEFFHIKLVTNYTFFYLYRRKSANCPKSSINKQKEAHYDCCEVPFRHSLL